MAVDEILEVELEGCMTRKTLQGYAITSTDQKPKPWSPSDYQVMSKQNSRTSDYFLKKRKGVWSLANIEHIAKSNKGDFLHTLVQQHQMKGREIQFLTLPDSQLIQSKQH